jgi:hypothetical protein
MGGQLGGSTIGRIRAWCGHSARFNSASGFGLGLVLGVLVCELDDVVYSLRHGSFEQYWGLARQWGVPTWLWVLVGTSLGMFAAGAAAFTFVKTKPCSERSKAVLMAGLAFVFVFPFASFAFTAWNEIEAVGLRGSGPSIGRHDLLEFFGFWWWDAFAAFGVRYLLWIVLWSAVYYWLRRPTGDDVRTTSGVPAVRPRDIVLGLLLVVFALVIGLGTWLGFSREAQLLLAAKDTFANQPEALARAQAYAVHLQDDLWSSVAVRSLPFLIVGGLLLFPFGRQGRPT